MADRTRVGLIGLGFAAWELKLPAYQSFDDIEIVAVADPMPEARAQAEAKLGLPPEMCFADYREMLDRVPLDFVDVSTPHRTHLPIVTAAADAGVAVVCDKPLAMTLAEADEMIGVTERAGVQAGVHHNFSHFPSHRLVQQLLADGLVGDVSCVALSAMAIFAPGVMGHGPVGWRGVAAQSGGGILIDYGIHATYLALAALDGRRPQRVTAHVDRLLVDADVEDHAAVVLDCGDAFANLTLTWGSGTTGDLVVHGDRGSLKVVHPDARTSPHNVATGVAHLVDREEPQLVPLDWERFPLTWYYGGAIRSFADVVRGIARPDQPTLADGRAVLEIVLAAYKSAALGQSVALPLSPTDPVYQYGVLGLRELDLPPDSVILRRNLFNGHSMPAEDAS